MEAGTEVLFRDSRDIQPPVAAYEDAPAASRPNMYASLEPPAFVACVEDIWQPLTTSGDESGLAEIKVTRLFAL